MSSSVTLFGNALSKYNSASKTNEDRLKFYDSFLKSVKGLSTIPHNANNYDEPPIETPTITPTASTENNSDDGMAALLKAMEEFGKVDYTPTTGGGFADFLKQYGNENARAYSEGVRGANAAFYRSLMNYGKNAEMLGANGLSSSGVSDYGNAAAYAARQGAVTELGKARLQADTDAMGEYTGRISAANAEGKAQAQAMANAKVQGLLTAIQSGIVDEASARIIAQQSGVYDEEEIDKFVGAITAETANSETLFANTQSLFDNFIANGFTPEQAKAKVEQYAQQMPSAYNAELIDSIYNTHVNVQNMGKSDDPYYVDPNDETYKVNLAAATEAYNKSRADGNSHETALSGVKTAGITDERILNQLKPNYDSGIINNAQNSLQQMLASANYSVAQKATSEGGNYVSKAYLDNLVAQNILTEDSEEYKNQLNQLQTKNSESLMNLIDGAHDNGAKGFDLRMACAEFGIAYDEANKEAVGAEVVKAARERAEELYFAGDISEEQFADYLHKDFQYEVDGSLEEPRTLSRICGKIVDYSNYTDDMSENGEEAYVRMIESAVEMTNFTLSKKFTIRETGQISGHRYDVFEVKTNNGQKIKFTYENSGASEKVKAEDVSGEITVINAGANYDKWPKWLVGAAEERTIVALNDGRLGIKTKSSTGEIFISPIQIAVSKDWSDDQCSALEKMIAYCIVNNK